ncbi:CehA/McbA family metallohydrolase [Streptacidiphilus sp. N1-10]|uniref:CehA/McbA family metallohydrolase n=1 Tax=Streptacidiphilus jeojiensis TaxID=3229225 RepID=A0ABV6XNX7_9ACTN
MTTLMESAAAAFAEDGFTVIPGVLSEPELARWRAVVRTAVSEDPPSEGHSGPYFLWPRFPSTGHPLHELYAASRVPDLVRELLRPGLTPKRPAFGQIALTLPPHPHSPGGPHIDGLTPTEPDGRPGTFTVLAGVLLTDQRDQDRGNLWVWPGTHLRTGAWLREHGADALSSAVPYPPVELGRPVQVTAPAGSLLLAHYLLAHNIGGHFGAAEDERRETVYFRLQAAGHRDRWRQAVTDPLGEFAPVGESARSWYRGDCHVHSVHSDGELTPDQLIAGARAAGLDFLATTEHNTADAHAVWGKHAGSDPLVILGEEVTTRTGHWLALGLPPGLVVDWRYGVRDDAVDRHLDEVHRVGGLCVAAHPHAPYDSGTFMYPFQGFDAVEVWNGPWTSDVPWQADNEAALAEWGRSLAADIHQGRWRPAVGNSDTHLEGQIGIPHTVVLAEELSSEAVLAGIGAGRSWIAASAAVELSFTASAGGRSAGIGDRLDTGDEPAVVRAEVQGVPSGAVSFHTEKGRAHQASLAESGAGTVEWRTSEEESAFVRVEVRYADGRMAALSNPIILG